MQNFKIVAPCDLKIIDYSILKENDFNCYKISFLPKTEKFVIPIDGRIDFIKPLNYHYEILTKEDDRVVICIGTGSKNAFGFGFDMKIATGQPVSLGDRMVSVDFEDVLKNITSLESKILIKTKKEIKIEKDIINKEFKALEIIS